MLIFPIQMAIWFVDFPAIASHDTRDVTPVVTRFSPAANFSSSCLFQERPERKSARCEAARFIERLMLDG